MIGRLTTAKDSVRAMIDSSRNLAFDNTLEHTAATLARKSTATQAVLDTVSLALDAGGGAAYASGSGIDRLFRDVQGARYHPLSTERQERFTGRVVLGLDPGATSNAPSERTASLITSTVAAAATTMTRIVMACVAATGCGRLARIMSAPATARSPAVIAVRTTMTSRQL